MDPNPTTPHRRTEASLFTYDLPETAIAQVPVEPRHEARLLDTRDDTDHRFLDLSLLLRPGDLVVVNRTRVRRARLEGVKPDSGGKVEALLLGPRPEGGWRAMVRPARRLRVGSRLVFGEITAVIVEGPVDGLAVLDLAAPGDLEDAIEREGATPLPPYITQPLTDPDRYQTMFATRTGSAAAPTAGLHFTPEVVLGLERRGVEMAEVELQVGLDTFRPISTAVVEDHPIHREWCSVPEATAEAVGRCRDRHGRVVAVGTTTLRTLESWSTHDGGVRPGDGETDLYLTPGTPIEVVDLLVTNFHLPGSTLLVLLEAFMGSEWRRGYRLALERGYRFLSFGDSMLCERSDRR